MMEFYTTLTLVLLASAAHIAFAQTSSEGLLLNACQISTNHSLEIEFLEYVIARHSIYGDNSKGQRITILMSSCIYIR